MGKLFWAVLIASTAFVVYAQPARQELGEGWILVSERGENWPAEVPGTVHTDLMAAGVIEDPFFGINEEGMQWIDKEDWEYKTTFDVDGKVFSREHAVLVFEGLDTYADVVLNGDTIIRADNMFRRWDADVKGLLREKGNELTVHFYSPIEVAMPMWEATPWRNIIESGNDQAVRGGLKAEQKLGVYVRKAGYHFGWDWGPRLVTSGIWRPVYIEAWDAAKIDDVFYRQTNVTAERAEVEVTVETGLEEGEIVVKNNGKRLARYKGKIDGKKTLTFTIDNPELWWTNGLGGQHLYEFEVEVRSKGRVIDTHKQRLGLRSLRVVVEPDQWGESFYVELNGVPVFMKGANIIPLDNFLPRVTYERYEKTIHDAVMSNMNMLRVWGGGIYENEVFYDLCDEHGILVWQDFMFSCALYPAEGKLMENIKEEARQNVRRLRNRTCLALWCGNNECLDMWFQWGVKRRYDRYNPEWSEIQWRQFTDLYYKALPEIVEQEHPGIAYRKSSPYSNDYGMRSDSIGDYHDWDVWGQGLEFDLFNHKKSRFFSEYGFQGFPSFETVKKFAPDEQDWSPTSRVMLSHQRAGTNGNQKIDAMMRRDYGEPRDFESFCYLSQLMQADAMRIAMEAHRREMPRCMGSLIWQHNDCWPVASWSGVDWYGNWKAQQYAIRRSFEDIILSLAVEDGMVKIYAVNDRQTPVDGTVAIRVTNDMENFAGYSGESGIVTLAPNSSVSIGEVMSREETTENGNVIVHVVFTDTTGKRYENYYYSAKHKDMNYQKPNIEVSVAGGEVTLKSDVFARGVCLVADGVIFSDNFFDLLPRESRTVQVLSGELKGTPRVISYADAVK
jgi:beta-mannosidase